MKNKSIQFASHRKLSMIGNSRYILYLDLNKRVRSFTAVKNLMLCWMRYQNIHKEENSSLLFDCIISTTFFSSVIMRFTFISVLSAPKIFVFK